MKLKRLDIHGFKSFYHRTTLVFDEGITVVVGPNGCGKSNIVDAIKWVMGAQGPRALRSGSMEDVIFNGSERRGPLGMCEVTLTLLNDDDPVEPPNTDHDSDSGGMGEGEGEGRQNSLPTTWRNLSEIAIERRMERKAGSDYLINKSRCRLADIQELVAGTGVASGTGGQRAYAIIEQGHIDRIVSARADERRALIEEAAGITRYRVRRRDAERKMHETRQNLERVEDVVAEVEQQLRSLRRQAKKAERYREYRAEAQRIALWVAAFDYLKLAAERAWLTRDLEDKITRETDAIVAQQAAESRAQVATVEGQRTADIVGIERERLRSLESEAKLAEGQHSLLVRESEALTQRADRSTHEIEALDARCDSVAEMLDEATEQRDALDSVADDDGYALERLELAHRSAQQALQSVRQRIGAERRQASEEASRLARNRGQREAAKQRVVELQSRQEQIASELDHAHQELALTGERGAEAAERARQAEESVAEANHARQGAAATRGRCGEHLDRAAQAERRVHENLTAARSRLRSLEELEVQREGFGEGSKAALARGREAGVIGPVSEIFGPPADLERAVAAALGDTLKGVLVDDLSAGIRLIADLRAAERGHGTFVSGQWVAPAGQETPPTEGIRGRLADLLAGTGSRPELQAALLRDVLLVESADAAARIALSRSFTGTMVTPDGDRFDDSGVVRGGHGGVDTAPLGRRRETRELRAQVALLDDEERQAQETQARLRDTLRAARAGEEQAAQALHRAELKLAEARKDMSRFENELARNTAQVDRQAQQLTEIEARLQSAQTQVTEMETTLGQAESAQVDRHHIIARLEDEASEAESEAQAALESLHEAKMDAVTRREQAKAAREKVDRLDRQLDDLAARVDRLRVETEAARQQLAALLTNRSELQAQMNTAQAAAESQATQLADAEAAHHDASAAHREASSRATACTKARELARETSAKAKLALQSSDLRLENLIQRVESAHPQPLGEVVHDFHLTVPPTPQDIRRLSELESLLSRMGDINLTAIDAHAEVNERHEFLTRQQQDLLAALDDLDQAIGQINRTSRDLFRRTFAAVNEKFCNLFPRLFRGGEAELLLTNPDDLLETGIEIRVQPPGKRVQDVNLLSGGEKAMCAIALVFAVFQVKPSPFCVLDEVDAPLDDANIGRFNDIIREMSRTSQIVLVTHNKRTMEIADVLCGITMEEPGVGKLVSVRMT